MKFSRRWFIGGAASFGAFQGCRFAESVLGRGGSARLRFGVVSDIHIIAENTDRGWQGNSRTFRHALKWFDAQGADGVMIAGDLADNGLISQLQCVADAWKAVFPEGRSRLDGRPVEKIFVSGNHDWEGAGYGHDVFGAPSNGLTTDIIRTIGMKKIWEELFEEEYEPIFSKSIRGFTFVGAHWDEANGSGWKGGPDPAAFLAAHGKEIDPSLPFFYCQHPHPKDTCYGSWAWGHDCGRSTKALSAHSNAIAFSGHSHYSPLDERTVWQGAFTSIGTGSLRYAGEPYDEIADEGGFENTEGPSRNRQGSVGKLMARTKNAEGRNGLLVSVYDDRITIVRRDFLWDRDLGPDWVMPLPAAESKPFAFAERAKKFAAPQFPSGAAVKVERTRHKFGKKDGEKEIEVFALTVPSAAQTFVNRVLRYRVTVELKDGNQVVLKRHVLAPDYHLPVERAGQPFVLPMPVEDMPKDGEFRFAVTPINCFGKSGTPLATDYFKV